MNTKRLFQFSDAESHLNSRRSESDFVPGSHRSYSITRSLNCLRGISEPILRCYQTSVVVQQAQEKPLYTHGVCVWVRGLCVQTRMKFRFPMQEQLGRLISVAFGCLLIYWFIYSFWERKKNHLQKNPQLKRLPKQPTHPHAHDNNNNPVYRTLPEARLTFLNGEGKLLSRGAAHTAFWSHPSSLFGQSCVLK